MAQRRRARDAAQQEHDECVDGVRESAVSVRVQQLGVAARVPLAFFLWASLQQWMCASHAMQRNVDDFAERIQQRRRASMLASVSQSSSRTIPPTERYRRRRPLLTQAKFWRVPRQRARRRGDARSVPRHTTASSGPCRPYVIFRVDGVWLYLVRCPSSLS